MHFNILSMSSSLEFYCCAIGMQVEWGRQTGRYFVAVDLHPSYITLRENERENTVSFPFPSRNPDFLGSKRHDE